MAYGIGHSISCIMEIIFLGTNGWYDTETGNTVCALIKTEKYDIVLDAGNGIYKLDRYVNGKKPVYLFLSHFHLDHIIGLHALLKFSFKKGLYICAGKGARKTLSLFLRKPFTVPLAALKYKTRILELPAETGRLPFNLKTLPLVHTDPVLGFRFKIRKKTITYCTDTGWCSNALKLAAGSDLLITECSYRPGEQNPGWPHLNPETAALLAAQVGAGKLALTHFDPERYPGARSRKAALRVARRIFPCALAAEDGLRIKL